MTDARINVTANSDQAERSLLSLGKSLDNTTGKMLDMSGVAGMLAGALSVGAFAALIKSTINAADELAKLSQKTGTTVEELAGLKFAADQNGTSLDTVARAGQKLAGVMADKAEIFKAMGITATSSTGAMVQLADTFAKMPDGVDKSALATKLFGDRLGADMIPFLNQGTQALGELIEKGQQFAPFTAEAARQAEVFNDTLDELKARSNAVGVSLTVQLLPKLTDTIKALNDLSASGTSVVSIGGAISTVFETVVVLVAEVGFVVQTVGRQIGGLVAQFNALGEGGGIFAKEGREAWSRVGAEIRADAEAARKELDAFADRMVNGPKKSAAAPEAPTQDGRAGKGLLDSLTGTAKTNTDALEKLRQQDIAGWVKYADAVLAEDERIAEALRKQAEDETLRQEASALAWEQQVAARLAKMQEANLSEAEIERGKLTQIQNDLAFALQSRFITEQQYQQMLEQAQLQHEAKMGDIMAQSVLARQKISQMSWQQQATTAVSWMKNITSASATSNKEMFELNKAAAVTEAGINTYRAAVGAYAALASIPYVGPFLGAAAAAVAIAAGMANIQAIKSAQFGSSTSAPSIGGGGAIPVTSADPGGASGFPVSSAAVPEFEKQKTQVSVTLVGSQFSYQQVAEEIIPLINEAAGNGADIRVAYA